MKADNSLLEAMQPASAFRRLEEAMIDKTNRLPSKTYLLAVMGGVFISIAFVFYITVTTSTGNVPFGLSRFVGGLAFSLGLILVVICGGELFTSSVLSITARASNRITTVQLLRNWSMVYVGNLFGAAFFVMMIWYAQQHMAGGGQWGVNALVIAKHKLQYSFGQAVALGVLCNLMVCLAIWMTFFCRTVTDKFLVILLPIAMFVASGFEHSIANMFLIPLGILIQNFASPEFWAMTGHTASEFSDLTMTNFVNNNLVPVTIGNILGGSLLVGMTNWLVYRKPTNNNENQNQKDFLSSSK